MILKIEFWGNGNLGENIKQYEYGVFEDEIKTYTKGEPRGMQCISVNQLGM